jgi:hypothetical protein
MSKFNRSTTTSTARGPIRAVSATPDALTHEGGPAYSREAKGELFLLAVTNMVAEDSFYESGLERDTRYKDLVHQVAVEDPEWIGGFLEWLRGPEANMRSASLVGALEAAKAMVNAQITGSRSIVNSVLQRADEPGEAVAYWRANYGRSMPKPVKRGIGDGAIRLYSERSMLKYDTASHGVRFADVLELTHAGDKRGSRQELRFGKQGQVFKHAIDRRHDHDGELPDSLGMIHANAWLRKEAETNPEVMLDTERLREAGMTWEDTLSLVGSKVPKAKLWEALIPVMAYFATVRNLRNFDEAGISDEAAKLVEARLTDPEQVANSRLFPFRFLSAYQAVNSLRWGPVLEKALGLVMRNLPEFTGRTLILVDTSASMGNTVSGKSKMRRAEIAALFGAAVAARNPGRVDLYGFADGVFKHDIPKGESVLRTAEKFIRRIGEVGHGTEIAAAVQQTLKGHDRVLIFSDMQTFGHNPFGTGDVSRSAPDNVAIYGFNLAGYKNTAIAAGQPNRHELGGLTDSTFKVIPLLEAKRDGTWPWQMR